MDLEVPEDRSLPAALGPALRATLMRMNRGGEVEEALKRALGALVSFARVAKYSSAALNSVWTRPRKREWRTAATWSVTSRIFFLA